MRAASPRMPPSSASPRSSVNAVPRAGWAASTEIAVTCAVAGGDGSVRCWGAPDYDPWAPNAPSAEVLTEVRAVPGLLGAVEVSVGYGLACARHRDGRVACWRGVGGRDALAAPRAVPW